MLSNWPKVTDLVSSKVKIQNKPSALRSATYPEEAFVGHRPRLLAALSKIETSQPYGVQVSAL